MEKLDLDQEYSFKPPCADELFGGIVYTGKPMDYAKFFYSLDYRSMLINNSKMDTVEKRSAIPRRLIQKRRLQGDPIRDRHQRIFLMRTTKFLTAAITYVPCSSETCEPCIAWRKIPDTATNGYCWRRIGDFV